MKANNRLISLIITLIKSCGVIRYNLRSLDNRSMIHLNSSLASYFVDVLAFILCRAHDSMASNFFTSLTSRLRHMIIWTILSERVRKSTCSNSCGEISSTKWTWEMYLGNCLKKQAYKNVGLRLCSTYSKFCIVR